MSPKAGRGRAALAGAIALALVTGCGPAGFSTGDIRLDGPTDGVAWNLAELGLTCDDGPFPQWDAPPGADVVVVRATRCINRIEHVPGDGEWEIRYEQEATIGLEALATALRLPDVPVTDQPDSALVEDVPCDTATAPIVITLTDSTGRRYVPRIPHKCGDPLPAVIDAIKALAWTDTATRPLARLRSELAVTSGCEDEWKPAIGAAAAGLPGEPAEELDPTPRPLLACRYEIRFDQPIPFTDGITLHGAELVGASTVDASAAAELLTAVLAAPPAGACEPDEVSFAVVRPADVPAPWVAVELEGCYRATIGFEGQLRQLDAALVTRLLT
jgi:hypothetical protein